MSNFKTDLVYRRSKSKGGPVEWWLPAWLVVEEGSDLLVFTEGNTTMSNFNIDVVQGVAT